MRAAGNKVPVLILTARDAIEGRIKGLDGGADDYMVKPFDLHELAALLHELMLNAGHVLSREQLGERLYAWGEEIESNAIDVHVHHLRRKLAPGLIRTVRGVGYLMPRARHG